ncbi:MAG TPA: glycoside hydrolase family 36 protein [Vicinamibacteria bacterium]|nr:glycoside hydrolase family 36 protein [Vicinamibacteria bacterium]
MSRCLPVLFSAVLAGGGAAAEAGPPLTVAHHGWTITADGERGVVAVSHERLGPVLQSVRLNLRGELGRSPWSTFSARLGDGGLVLRTAAPATVWRLEPGPDALRVSCTSARAVLTAEAPAPKDRWVARLLDPEGAPVEWVGTDEVKHGYGGSDTRNPSFLPRRNPDVMYFSLGQVSGATFHALFDRRSDTAVRFPDDTLMERDPRDADRLDVTIPVPGNALVRVLPDYFVKTLGVPFYVPFDDAPFPRPPTIWCSWTSYYAEVKEDDVVRNADWIAANLKDYGFDYVQLDDGYDRGKGGEHRWIEDWDRAKFPHGPKWLAGYIKSKGLRAGLWLVPNAYAGAVEQHPDWYLYDKQGKVVRDYDTPALDSTHPAVLDFLRKLFTTLGDWGFEYYKFDGEHALPRYVPAVDRARLHDPRVDPIVAYRKRLALIRETIGPRTFVEGCPAGTPLNGIGTFNSYFDGDDVYNSWPGMHALFSSISANAFWNHVVAYVMPGEGIEVGPPMAVAEAQRRRPASFVETARSREEPLTGFGTTLAEARTLVSLLSLTGVAYPLASVMPELPQERVDLLKSTLPTLPILPIDLFSRGTDMRWDRFKDTRPDDYIHNYPEVLDLKVNARSGTYDVVGLTNWRGETTTRELSFEDQLGLPKGSRCVVFDYWGRRLLGVFADVLPLEIGPHDTRVVLVHPLQPQPQLVGISRHLTGVPSVLDLGWDPARRTLHGSSQAMPGEEYALFVHVPDGMDVTRVRAVAGGDREIPARQELTGGSLTVSFRGQAEPVAWQVEFGREGGKS